MNLKFHSYQYKKILPGLIIICFILFLYKSYGAMEYTYQNFAEFVKLTKEHIILVFITMFFSNTAGIFIGIMMTRKGWENISPVVMSIINIWQSIPSLGVIALAYSLLPLIGLSGIGLVPAFVAIFAFSVAPVVRNTFAGINSVDKHLIEAATGMGMTKTQILFNIEIPNALNVIMGGIKTSTALIVGVAPLACLIGGGGLGFWIFTGIQLVDMGIMMAGAIPVGAIAIIFNYILDIIEKLIVSQGLQSADNNLSAI